MTTSEEHSGLKEWAKSDEWPAIKKAIWDVIMAETLNNGKYINAFELTEKLYQAANTANTSEIARLRDALEWYADEVMAYSITQANEPRSAVHGDRGKRAREALDKS